MEGIRFKRVTIVISVLLFIITAFILKTLYNRAYNEGKQIALKIIPQNGNINFIISLDSVDSEYNHVGYDWKFIAYVNEISNNTKLNLLGQTTIKTNINDSIEIFAGAEEGDTLPDSGESSSVIAVNSLNLAENNSIRLAVYVKEDRGRYAGNTSTHTFNFSIYRKVSEEEIKKAMEDNVLWNNNLFFILLIPLTLCIIALFINYREEVSLSYMKTKLQKTQQISNPPKDNLENFYKIYKHPSGAKYIGEFKDDYFHGYGKIYYTDGATLEGQFVYGSLEGNAIYTYPNGKKEIRQFENGEEI